jgi:hypothetical protein
MLHLFKVCFICLPQIAGPRSMLSSNMFHGGLPQAGSSHSLTVSPSSPSGADLGLFSVWCWWWICTRVVGFSFIFFFILLFIDWKIAESSIQFASCSIASVLLSLLSSVYFWLFTDCNYYLLCVAACLWVNVQQANWKWYSQVPRECVDIVHGLHGALLSNSTKIDILKFWFFFEKKTLDVANNDF